MIRMGLRDQASSPSESCGRSSLAATKSSDPDEALDVDIIQDTLSILVKYKLLF